jgi:hypothetical protein
MTIDAPPVLEVPQPKSARRRSPLPAGTGRNRVARQLAFAIVAIITVFCVAVAGATLVHRIRLAPVRRAAPDVGIGHESLLVLVPVPAAKIKAGDLIVVDRKDTHTTELDKVDAVISQVKPAVEVRDGRDRALALNLPSNVWRVSTEVPFLGTVVKVLPGSILTWILIPAGVVLLAWSRWSRRRRRRALEHNVTPAPSA